MVVKDGGLKVLQIQDDGCGISVSYIISYKCCSFKMFFHSWMILVSYVKDSQQVNWRSLKTYKALQPMGLGER